MCASVAAPGTTRLPQGEKASLCILMAWSGRSKFLRPVACNRHQRWVTLYPYHVRPKSAERAIWEVQLMQHATHPDSRFSKPMPHGKKHAWTLKHQNCAELHTCCPPSTISRILGRDLACSHVGLPAVLGHMLHEQQVPWLAVLQVHFTRSQACPKWKNGSRRKSGEHMENIWNHVCSLTRVQSHLIHCMCLIVPGFGVLECLRIVKHSCTSAQFFKKRQNMLDTWYIVVLVWSFDSALLGGLALCLLLCGSLACQAYRKTNASNPVTSQASWHFHGRVWLQCKAIECLMCVVWTWNVSMTTTPCNLENRGAAEILSWWSSRRGISSRNLWRDLACKQLPAAPSSSQNLGSCQNWIGSQSCCASDHHTFRLWDRQMDRWTDGRSAVALSGNGQMSSAWSPSTPRDFLFKSALRRSADLTQSEKWWFNRKKGYHGTVQLQMVCVFKWVCVSVWK